MIRGVYLEWLVGLPCNGGLAADGLAGGIGRHKEHLCNDLGTESLRVERNVVFDERGDELVRVVVACMATQRHLLALRLAESQS